ncbi:exonuclease domain-containing protein [Puniceicoccus vermicola]|uniref:phosphodiesterase I n=1 Tax=Puniceicoccus vermicola TaxID=388746 RepID=A0A7X1E3E7_9BACT|nr:VRR-NUC domain-containing protein [Puniceicoccus vermicola]
MAFPKLQPFYYRDHFLEMLAFLEMHCSPLMEEEHRAFIREFRSMEGRTQAVLVRMVNRKGEFFRIRSLNYEEIGDPSEALRDLMERGWARPVFKRDLPELLHRLTKEELVGMMDSVGLPLRGRRSKAKAQLVDICLNEGEVESLYSACAPEEWVALVRPECTGFLLFLYFGFQAEDLTVFTMRDLGILKKSTGALRIEPAFPDLESARNGYFYARLRDRMKQGQRSVWLQMVSEVSHWPRRESGEDELLFDRAVTRLGRSLESVGEVDAALVVYGRTDSYPAIERLCRLQYSAGETETVRMRLERVIADPPCDEAQIFAEDFYARKFGCRRVGALTSLLREAPVIEIDESFRGQVESGVAEYFTSRDMPAYWTENGFWRGLFGVVFREELFGPEGAGVPNEFVRVPICLRDGSFYPRFEEAIERKLATLEAGQFSMGPGSEEREDSLGSETSFKGWGGHEKVREFLRKAPGEAVAAILRRMARDFQAHSSGFPDLLVFESDGVKAVEVKAEGDSIRRNQLAQFRRLQEVGFPVEVVRVRWCVDPDQVYTVVDVETTGGSPGRHRLTEVAAVKVRRGQVVDRFQTLLNPERSIPRYISELTGITDEMVRDAPTFTESVEDLAAFLGEGVFVAHNAKFDYGFLRAEFARCGREFKRPVLCTVVESRRVFPGLPSYGLKNLSRHFSIPLEQHHRALADAEAAAAILIKIQEKRREAARKKDEGS